jgi:pSer/pThr/pTyr-binding forkhead associated (FHA) protein
MADTIPCPACGTDNSPDAIACHVCDYELRAQLPAPTSGPSKCPRCGSGVAGGASFCQVCGQAVERRFARPHTGALNVRALFGDEESVPQRAPMREHTEIAPSARGQAPSAAPPRFAPPGGFAHQLAQQLGKAAQSGQGAQQPQRPVAGQIGQRQAPLPDPADVEPAAPRGRRRPAPRPQPAYSGFDAGDSSGDRELGPPSGHPGQARPSAAPVYAEGPPGRGVASRSLSDGRGDPAASANNLPRPRHQAHAEPMSAARDARAQMRTHRGYDDAAAAAAAHGGGAAPWSAPQPSTSIRLVLVGRDGREGEAFPLPYAGIEIGRHGAIGFPSDPFVSPHHAKIVPIDGGVHIADLSSRNGVYLRLTEPTPVYPGDHFLLGNQLLRLDRLDGPWQEQPLDEYDVRGFGSPVKPPWAMLVRVCVGEIEDDRYHLRGAEMTIGREQGEIVFPSDGFLSRAHARIRMEVYENTMNVMLEDLGSANGTYLRVRGSANVPYGAMFRVGDQIFRVRHD